MLRNIQVSFLFGPHADACAHAAFNRCFEFLDCGLLADGMRAAAEWGTFGVSRWQLSNNLLHTPGFGMSQSWVVEQLVFYPASALVR
jgi:hypothetical protein